MRILVLGGAAIMARIAEEELSKTDVVSEVIIADIRKEKAKQIADRIGSKKVSAEFLDINDSVNLLKMLKASDLVINTVGPFYKYGVNMVKAAIEAKVNYVDICDDYDPTQQMLELNKAAKDAGVTILIGMGESPGTTNVLAKYGADKLDRVDEIHTYWTSSWMDPAGFACLYHMLHGLRGNTPQYLDGKLVNVPVGAGREVVEFPEPLGQVATYYMGHPEPVTLPLFIKGVKYATNRGGVVPQPWAMQYFFDLIEYGYATDEPIDVKGVSVAPSDVAVKMIGKWNKSTTRDLGGISTALRVDVKGERAGKNIRYSYVEDSVHHGMSKVTSTPLAIGAKMLCHGEIQEKGVLPPEKAIVNPKKYLEELAKKGISFNETETVATGIL